MMSFRKTWGRAWRVSFTAATLVWLAGTGPQARAQEADTDNATARRKAFDDWYNETYAEGVDVHKKAKKGGPLSASYRRFLNDAAQRERDKWAALLPGADGASAPAQNPAVAFGAVVGSTWTNIGPTNANYVQNSTVTLNGITDSGRPRDIVIDPANGSVIYVAMAAGGVWKTTDGGTTWSPKTEMLGSLATGSLAMDPSNSSVLYLGLGDPFDGTGIGLVKSVDGANNWSAPVYLGGSTTIPDLIVAPAATNVVLAATNAGLYRSTDSGASFAKVAIATGQAVDPYVWSLGWLGGTNFIVSLEANAAATTGTTDGQIWISSDNGATWTRSTGVTKAAGVGRMTLAVAPSNKQIVYALAAIPNATTASDLSDIFKSTDGGVTFAGLGAATKNYVNTNADGTSVGALLNGQGWYNHLAIVDPIDPNTAYFGGALQLVKTTDGGTTFRQMTNWLAQFGLPYVHADFHAAAFGPGALYVGTDGGLFKSTDNGVTWNDDLNVGIASHLIYEVGSSPANPSAVIGGFQDNGTRVRVGNTSTFNQEIGGDGFACDINVANGNTMLGSLYYSRFYKSTDGGLNFSAACGGITGCGNDTAAPFFTKLAVWAGDATGNTLYTANNTKVFKSTNYAGRWSALRGRGLPTASFFIRNINTAKSNANAVGLVASGGRVFLSTNGGTNFTQSGALPNNGLSLSYLHYDHTNANVIYVASVAPDAAATHLWKSTNGGATWTAIDAGGFPTGIPVNIVVTDPADAQTLFAGTHLGVYRSTDGGATWARFGANMPLVNVTDINISPNGSLVRAATYGRSFWELVP